MPPLSEDTRNVRRRQKYGQDQDFQKRERLRCKYGMRWVRILRKHEASPLDSAEHIVRLNDAAGLLGLSAGRIMRLSEQGVLPEPIRQGAGKYYAFNLSDLVKAAETLQQP